MMEIIVRLLILLFLAFFGVSEEVGTPPPPQETFESLNLIDSVEATVLESDPAQIQLHITGSLPDGCQFPVQVEQTRAGDTITLKLYRAMPLAVACPAMLIMYDETITLEGTFDAGTYTIDVNGFVIEVTI